MQTLRGHFWRVGLHHQSFTFIIDFAMQSIIKLIRLELFKWGAFQIPQFHGLRWHFWRTKVELEHPLVRLHHLYLLLELIEKFNLYALLYPLRQSKVFAIELYLIVRHLFLNLLCELFWSFQLQFFDLVYAVERNTWLFQFPSRLLLLHLVDI